jgi:L-fuculose-phosphate aldolase
MTHDEAKRKLIYAGIILQHEGHADFTRGHVSVRVPDEPEHFFMKPHSFGFEEITMENILTIDLDGKVVAGTSRRHSEVFIHTEIYKARPDIQSVIHSHPPYSVALTATGLPLRPYCQPAAAFVDELPTFDDTMDLIRTPEMGAGVARALGPHFAAMMKSHGVAVTGLSLEEAVVRAIMLEAACMVQMVVLATGHIAPEFPAPEIARIKEKIANPEQYKVNFDYLVRKMQRMGVDKDNFR